MPIVTDPFNWNFSVINIHCPWHQVGQHNQSWMNIELIKTAITKSEDGCEQVDEYECGHMETFLYFAHMKYEDKLSVWSETWCAHCLYVVT